MFFDKKKKIENSFFFVHFNIDKFIYFNFIKTSYSYKNFVASIGGVQNNVCSKRLRGQKTSIHLSLI